MSRDAQQIAQLLAQNAEGVCRTYLSNGTRRGRYWIVGDVCNNKGQSLFVRLIGDRTGKGAAGKWTDAATGQHGDLLDLIALNKGHEHFRDALDEARSFLALAPITEHQPMPLAHRDRTLAAQRLFYSARPIAGTLAETYLTFRGLRDFSTFPALRFHPNSFRRTDRGRASGPALIAAVTNLSGRITAVVRTWLAPDGQSKSGCTDPRRSLGDTFGHGVRFNQPGEMLVAGEGIETMLSLTTVVPGLPVIAATSATHLAGLIIPEGLKRLYIAADQDAAGERAAEEMASRHHGLTIIRMKPVLNDWNDDLCERGHDLTRDRALGYLTAEDRLQFQRSS